MEAVGESPGDQGRVQGVVVAFPGVVIHCQKWMPLSRGKGEYVHVQSPPSSLPGVGEKALAGNGINLGSTCGRTSSAPMDPGTRPQASTGCKQKHSACRARKEECLPANGWQGPLLDQGKLALYLMESALLVLIKLTDGGEH